MSSVRISVSGQRALSTTIGDPASTTASMPTKVDDNIFLSMGSLPETQFILPLAARLERVKFRDAEYLRIVLPKGNGLQVYAIQERDEDGNVPGGQWPHVNVEVGKHVRDVYADAEVVEVVHERMGDLIPPTEPDES